MERTIDVEQRRNILPVQLVGKLRTGDTTPSVENVERFFFLNTGAVTVTDFLNGQEGQAISILGDGFTTVSHNANIKTNTGANKLLGTNKVYRFTLYEGVWVEDADETGGGGGGGAPTDATYWVDAAHGGLTNEAVVGSSRIMRGVLASRPAAALAGKLYQVTDGTPRLTRDNGATWDDLTTDWGYVVNKPATFAPSAHFHPAGEILGVIFGDGNYAINWDESDGPALYLRREQDAFAPVANVFEYWKQDTTVLTYINWYGEIFAPLFTGDHAGDGSALSNLDPTAIAGIVAVANGGTGNDWSAAAVRRIPYFSALGVLGLLAAPVSADDILQYDGANIIWGAAPLPANAVIIDPIVDQEISPALRTISLIMNSGDSLPGTGSLFSPDFEFASRWYVAGIAGVDMNMYIRAEALSAIKTSLAFGKAGIGAVARIDEDGLVTAVAFAGDGSALTGVTATPSDLSYDTAGGFTIPTGKFRVMADMLKVSGTDTVRLEGDSTLAVI